MGKKTFEDKIDEIKNKKISNYIEKKYVLPFKIPYFGNEISRNTLNQNIRLLIFFFFLILLLILIMNEHVYEYIIIRQGGLNHFTLCENIPDDNY